MSEPRNSSNSSASVSNPEVLMDLQEANAKYLLPAEQQVPKGYKQTGVGLIPEDWEVMPLAQLTEIRTGIAKNSNVEVGNPIQVYYLRVANVQDGFLDISDLKTLEINRNNIKRYEVLPGDVLMNEGGDLDKLGRGSIWRGEFAPCVHQNHVFVRPLQLKIVARLFESLDRRKACSPVFHGRRQANYQPSNDQQNCAWFTPYCPTHQSRTRSHRRGVE